MLIHTNIFLASHKLLQNRVQKGIFKVLFQLFALLCKQCICLLQIVFLNLLAVFIFLSDIRFNILVSVKASAQSCDCGCQLKLTTDVSR